MENSVQENALIADAEIKMLRLLKNAVKEHEKKEQTFNVKELMVVS